MEEIEDANIYVFTYATGMLGKIGHDLRLSVQRFELKAGDGQVRGTFWPESLRVDGAVQDGELDTGELSRADKAKIRNNIRKDVLCTKRYPTAEFDGEYEEAGDGFVRVSGTLQLAGDSRRIQTRLHRSDGRWTGSLDLTPSDWGIEQYSAVLGTVKVKDRVRVELDVADPAVDARD